MNTLLLHLREEKACVEEFLAVLDREEEAMKEGRFAELGEITTVKAQLLDRMAELDVGRVSVQVSMGFEPSRDGADAAASEGGAETRRIWASLLELAEQAKAANRRNGSMVYTHLDFTQKALHFLQASAQLFYGPDGTRRASSGAGTRLALG